MKFTQIVTGQWHTQDDKRIMHSVYALGEDGQVYKYEKKAWQQLTPLSKSKSSLVSAPKSSRPIQDVDLDDDIPF